MIYLDNAATSFPKPKPVIKEVNKCIAKYCANPGRSGHKLAIECSEMIYSTREEIADFLNYEFPEHVIFCNNATHGLNLAIKGVVNRKMHVIISDLEHNSVLRPLYKSIHEYGAEFSVYNSDLDLDEAIKPLVKDETRVLISTLSSNVTGKVISPYALSNIARKYNLKLILDSSQYIGHQDLDLSRINFDALVAPGHKALFGLQGSGFVIIPNGDNWPTLMEGGSGIDTLNEKMPDKLPERLEAGTLACPSIIGLKAGIEYIKKISVIEIQKKTEALVDKASDILSTFKHIKVYGAENGIVSFKVEGLSSDEVADILSKYDIACRSGLHCAPLIHKKLCTINEGLLRISFSYFNKLNDLDKLYVALKDAIK